MCPSSLSARAALRLLIAALALASAGCGSDEERDLSEDMGGGRVRVFAVGLRSIPAEMESLESFKASIDAIAEREILPNLAKDRANLLVFPENTGLLAAFIGERGADGRARTTSTAAFLELYSNYQEAVDYYIGLFGEDALPLGKRASIVPTDILARSLIEVFAALAKETGAWVAVTYNIAETEEVEDAALGAVLSADGEPPSGPVYRAKSAHLPNQTILFDPEGALHSRHEKEYLVPAEESALELDYGAPGNLGRARLPFGELGVVISKDAWMPDVLDRLALSGVNLLIQPEAFSGWAIDHAEDPSWSPDVVNEGGYAAVMKYAEFKANILPCLSMNFFDLIFDCQSAIWVDPHLIDEPSAFIGQDPMPGFARVAPWVIDDPKSGSLEERRAILRAEGEELIPGGARENEYLAGTVFFDLDLSHGFPERADGDIRYLAPLGEGERGEQRRAAAALLDDGARFIAFEDTREGASAIYGVRVEADGSIGEAKKLVESEGRALRPRLAQASGALLLVYQDGEPGARRIRLHRSTDGGESFGPGETLAEGEVWVPDLAADGAAVSVAYIDMRSGPARIHLRESGDSGERFGEPSMLEASGGEPYNTRQNQWSPSLAMRDGATAIAFLDFRSFAWEVYGAFRHAPNEGFTPSERLDDAFDAAEPIHSDPAIAILEDGSILLAHTDLRVRREDYDPRVRLFREDGALESVSLASSDSEGWSQWRPAIYARGEAIYAAFQDFRGGMNHIRYAISSDGGESFSEDRRLAEDAEADAFSPIFLPSADADAPPAIVFEATGSGQRQLALKALPH